MSEHIERIAVLEAEVEAQATVIADLTTRLETLEAKSWTFNQ